MPAHHRVEPVAERLVHRRDDLAWHFVPDQQAAVAAPERDEPSGACTDLGPGHARLSLRPPQPAGGDEAAEVGVAGAVRREQHAGGGGRRGVRDTLGGCVAGGAGAVLGADRDLRAEDQRDAERARPHMRAHRAVDAIAVGQGEPRQAEGVCLLDQLVGGTRPFEKREVALAPQRDVGHRVRSPLSVTAPPSAARLGEQPGWRDTIARHAVAPAARGAAVQVSTAGRHPLSVRAVPAQPLPHDLEGHGARRARAASAPLRVHSLGTERGADYVRRLSVIKSIREGAREPPSAGSTGQDADSPSSNGGGDQVVRMRAQRRPQRPCLAAMPVSGGHRTALASAVSATKTASALCGPDVERGSSGPCRRRERPADGERQRRTSGSADAKSAWRVMPAWEWRAG